MSRLLRGFFKGGQVICEICKKNRIQRVIEESKKSMKRFTEKLKKEVKNAEQKQD